MSRLLRASMRADRERGRGFPFDVPVIRSLETLDLSADVTFFVGENGSGKSTLLEALAIASEVPTAGAAQSADDPALAAQRKLAGCLRLAWKLKSKRGFFLRAEDLIGYQRQEASTDARCAREEAEFARGEKVGAEGTTPLLEHGWERTLSTYDHGSHGETFLEFFQNRIHGTGLYLIDEPEAALSPTRQLQLVRLLKERTGRGAQFVIATHSPIILGVPGARILSFEGGTITPALYDELEHVRVMREFLTNREEVLKRLK